jgi:Flp pilus assembly pilin Flp
VGHVSGQAPRAQQQPSKKEKREVMKNLIARFIKKEEGQDLIEYALLAALISVVLAAVLPNVATAITAVFNAVIGALT